MKASVDALEFEKAAVLRDKIEQLTAIASRQKVVTNDNKDRDIITIAYEGKDSACSVFNIRNGKLISKKQLRLSTSGNEEESNIYSAAIKFYYGDFVEIPDEIVLDVKPGDLQALTHWLNSRSEKKVSFIFPQRGSLKSLVKMCKENALLQLKEIQLQKMKKEGYVSYSVSALKRDLRLKNLPRKIECFDISNLQGSDTVAGMVGF
jgi:excinuclease ABC subunit C